MEMYIILIELTYAIMKNQVLSSSLNKYNTIKKIKIPRKFLITFVSGRHHTALKI